MILLRTDKIIILIKPSTISWSSLLQVCRVTRSFIFWSRSQTWLYKREIIVLLLVGSQPLLVFLHLLEQEQLWLGRSHLWKEQVQLDQSPHRVRYQVSVVMLGSSSINPQGSRVLTLPVLFLCAVCSIGPWMAMCKETCVSSAAVRDILTDLASCWIQGTVHSYIELSGIQQF